jgi:hypothetical protein
MVLTFRVYCNKVDYPSLRHLRQQMPNEISHTLSRRVCDLRANRTQLPELDQKEIKVRPLPIDRFPNGLSGVGSGTSEVRILGGLNGEVSKISVVGRDGSQCRGNPPDVPRIGLKHHILEFRRF